MTDISTTGAGSASVFCQISGRDISPESCAQTQGQEGCFGCAAHTRRCESCLIDFVAVAATGTCSSCTTAEIENEKDIQLPAAPEVVTCQMMKRRISDSMCRSMQGQDECRGCTALSRVCESCSARPVRFPQYGMCFTCSVKEFGNDWIPAEEVKEEQRLSKAPRSSGGEAELPENATKTPVERAQKRNSATRNQALPVSHRNKGRKLPEGALDRARELVILTQRASYQFLMDQLGVNTKGAQSILKKLEKEKVVGPGRSSRGREVLITPPTKRMSGAAKQNEAELVARVLGVVARLMLRAKHPRIAAADVIAVLVAESYQEEKRLPTKNQASALLKQLSIRTYKSNGVEVIACSQYPHVRALCIKHGVCSTEEAISSSAAPKLPENLQSSDLEGLTDLERRVLLSGNSIPDETKIQRLQELIKVVGECSELGRVLDEVITDLEKLQQIRPVLKILLK